MRIHPKGACEKMSIQEVILLFADVVKEAMPFVFVFFFGGYIVKVFCNAAFGGRFKL